MKKNELQDPENKLWFTPNETMAPIFGVEKINGSTMSEYLMDHLKPFPDQEAIPMKPHTYEASLDDDYVSCSCCSWSESGSSACDSGDVTGAEEKKKYKRNYARVFSQKPK